MVLTSPVVILSFGIVSPEIDFQRMWFLHALCSFLSALKICCSRFLVVKSSGPRYSPGAFPSFRCRRRSSTLWVGSHCSSSMSGVVGLIVFLNDSLVCWRLWFVMFVASLRRVLNRLRLTCRYCCTHSHISCLIIGARVGSVPVPSQLKSGWRICSFNAASVVFSGFHEHFVAIVATSVICKFRRFGIKS